jgi:hypothetical protein
MHAPFIYFPGSVYPISWGFARGEENGGYRGRESPIEHP